MLGAVVIVGGDDLGAIIVILDGAVVSVFVAEQQLGSAIRGLRNGQHPALVVVGIAVEGGANRFLVPGGDAVAIGIEFKDDAGGVAVFKDRLLADGVPMLVEVADGNSVGVGAGHGPRFVIVDGGPGILLLHLIQMGGHPALFVVFIADVHELFGKQAGHSVLPLSGDVSMLVKAAQGFEVGLRLLVMGADAVFQLHDLVAVDVVGVICAAVLAVPAGGIIIGSPDLAEDRLAFRGAVIGLGTAGQKQDAQKQRNELFHGDLLSWKREDVIANQSADWCGDPVWVWAGSRFHGIARR